ncbi:MAG: ABC transporter permease subunit [Magnetococcales bacterium]|nr:ABC transporter permease subunit [Magnetococcales bacterium]NGZ29461.1 ABC transporter permease subunit [Magnetococcales bacterium]
MKAILTIAFREWRSMFLSPLAWTLLAVLSALLSFMSVSAVANYQTKQMQYQSYGMMKDFSLTDWTIAPVFGNAAVLLLLILPLVTMRLVADEKRRQTWAALASSPLSSMQIILGKYVGFLLFLLVTVLLITLPSLTLFAFGSPDVGQVFSGVFGLFLVAASFGAVGLAASSATENPIVAALLSFGVLLMLWIISWMGESSVGALSQILTYISLLNHFDNFLKGVVTSEDLAYFLILICLGILFARQRLAAERIQG